MKIIIWQKVTYCYKRYISVTFISHSMSEFPVDLIEFYLPVTAIPQYLKISNISLVQSSLITINSNILIVIIP